MAEFDLSTVMNLADAQVMYKDLRDRMKEIEVPVEDVKVDGVSVVVDGIANIPAIPTVPVTDVQTNGTSILQNGIANIPVGNYNTYGVFKSGYGLLVNMGALEIQSAGDSNIKSGDDDYYPIVPYRQHTSVFYGLSKVAGVDLKNATVTVGTYPDASKQAIQRLFGLDGILGDYESATASKAYAIGETFIYNGKRYRATAAIAQSDVIAPGTNCEPCPISLSDIQINGTSILENGVANIPMATDVTPGAMKVGAGLFVQQSGSTQGQLTVYKAGESDIKAGTQGYKPIVPQRQHMSVYYALAKLAGADMASASGETVGVYPQAQKTAIQTMLGIEADIPLVETVTGATVSITGMPNVRYICETAISELTITPPASGSIVVRFVAGSNCIISLPQTVKLPEWFDISSLEAGTTYEIIITDGVYGGVMSWAA